MGKTRILFFAEAVTLAHLARPLALIDQLSTDEWDVHLACPDNGFRKFLTDYTLPIHFLDSMAPSQFRRALDWGLRIFSKNLLRRYVADDLRLLNQIRPDVVVGDFRLSLSISARTEEVPYVNIANAYWRPEWCAIPPYPCLTPLEWLPPAWLEPVFRKVISQVFAIHARPFNNLRRRHGLAELPPDVRYFYTDGDTVLYADVPELYPGLALPADHHFLGPVLWSTKAALPEWWERLPSDRPVIFVTLGSSGRTHLLPSVIQGLSSLPVTIVAATLGKIDLGKLPANVFVAEELPMEVVTRRAQLVVSNGGSLTTYQALACGIPVIGICSNMDQLLNMGAIAHLGAGIAFRAARVDPLEICKTAALILEDVAYGRAAGDAAYILKQYDSGQCFREMVAQQVDSSGGRNSSPLG
ncbi:glycosyltransferase [Methylohalobius crimeensis]|uniref:glycosyltransferase n=1 Tax=Methylohalobius crimeensis TaxID=244365 RepID=UPI0003B75F5D|nr:glycosyltransferase [Methylohalobius crimeensis]